MGKRWNQGLTGQTVAIQDEHEQQQPTGSPQEAQDLPRPAEADYASDQAQDRELPQPQLRNRQGSQKIAQDAGARV